MVLYDWYFIGASVGIEPIIVGPCHSKGTTFIFNTLSSPKQQTCAVMRDDKLTAPILKVDAVQCQLAICPVGLLLRDVYIPVEW